MKKYIMIFIAAIVCVMAFGSDKSLYVSNAHLLERSFLILDNGEFRLYDGSDLAFLACKVAVGDYEISDDSIITLKSKFAKRNEAPKFILEHVDGDSTLTVQFKTKEKRLGPVRIYHYTYKFKDSDKEVDDDGLLGQCGYTKACYFDENRDKIIDVNAADIEQITISPVGVKFTINLSNPDLSNLPIKRLVNKAKGKPINKITIERSNSNWNTTMFLPLLKYKITNDGLRAIDENGELIDFGYVPVDTTKVEMFCIYDKTTKKKVSYTEWTPIPREPGVIY
jgi:hypothetical protein